MTLNKSSWPTRPGGEIRVHEDTDRLMKVDGLAMEDVDEWYAARGLCEFAICI